MNNLLFQTDDTPMVIGSFNFDNPFINEDTGLVGKADITGGEVLVFVNPKEGENIPHFHVMRKGKLHCCICIFEPLYFNHGTKTDKLSSVERKQLDSWLRKPFSKYSNNTRWEEIISAWIMLNNPTKRFPKGKPIQPDYRLLENMR